RRPRSRAVPSRRRAGRPGTWPPSCSAVLPEPLVLLLALGHERRRVVDALRQPRLLVGDDRDAPLDRVEQRLLGVADTAAQPGVDGVGERLALAHEPPQPTYLVGEVLLVALQGREVLACTQQREVGGLGLVARHLQPWPSA